MRISNTSKYRTDDLRVWLAAAFKNQNAKGTGVSVKITDASRFNMRGRAALGRQIFITTPEGLRKLYALRQGKWMLLRIPSDTSHHGDHFLADVAWLLMHEIQHLMGIDHRGMSSLMRSHWGAQPLPEWAKGLPLRLKEQPPKLTRTQIQERARTARKKKAEADEERARRMFATAVRRLQSARLAYLKWERKVRYYDNKHERTAASVAAHQEGHHA